MERLEEAGRWFKQALRDLKAARDSLNAENYEWTCFQSQQSAEKAVKAVALASGRTAWGRSITGLLEAISDLYDPQDIADKGRLLDRHYIPSRYPNAFESGHPSLYFDRETASAAILACESIAGWAKARLEEKGLRVQS